jgi:hypothetical protein
MPYTYGDGVLALEEVDLALEVEVPLSSPAARAPDQTSAAIGRRVAELVHHGATLQLGIGGVPDAVLASLTDRQGLKVWTEMISDGVLALDSAGSLDASAPITTSFLFGSPELYAWADANPRLRVLRTETTNDPSMIARQRKMTSINTALQVDLFAQANASRRPDLPGRVYSGFGGQTDFIVGALHSPGGRAIIALPSVHPKAQVSTVVPLLEAPATSFQHSHVVSEQGTAQVWGCDQHQQARGLVEEVAHPSAREGCWWRRGRWVWRSSRPGRPVEGPAASGPSAPVTGRRPRSMASDARPHRGRAGSRGADMTATIDLTTAPSPAHAHGSNQGRTVRLLGTLVLLAGLVMSVAGAGTWALVQAR